MQNDVGDIAHKINDCIDKLPIAHTELQKAASEYAIKKAEYSKDMGLTEMKLMAGKTAFLDDETIKNPKMAVIKDVTKALCWKSELAYLKAEASYKVAVSKIDSIRAKLMGYQSIYKHLSHLTPS